MKASGTRDTIERFTGFRIPQISVNANNLQCENEACPAHGFWRKLARTRNGGVFLQGRWYCSLDCFEQAIARIFASLMQLSHESAPRLHRVPIGLLLLGRGVIDQEQLKRALQAQREAGNGRLGRWLVRLGVASALEVSTALAAQWGCGIFPLDGDERYLQFSGLLPFALLESSRMMPVRYVSDRQLLFLAFSEDIDHSAIYAIERLLGNQTRPCVVSDTAMEQAMDRIRGMERPFEMVFDTLWDASEIARTVRKQAVDMSAEELVMARPRDFLWIRMKTSGDARDLMFREPARSRPLQRASVASG